MNTIVTRLLAGTALTVFFISATPALAATVVRETTVTESAPTVTTTVEETTLPAIGSSTFRFNDFDLNNDGILSIDEVGRMLFKLYDNDGNGFIDSNEYKRRAVITVVPMEKNVKIAYDLDGDGVADVTKYTYETFMQETMLTRFDKNRDGLSPREFTGRDFWSADVNHDKGVDLQEWQGTYIKSLDHSNKEKARFNK